MSSLVLAQHDNATLDKATLHAVTAALALGGDVHVLVAGAGAGEVAAATAKVAGVAKVLHVDDESLRAPLAETLGDLLLGLAKDYDALLSPSTSQGKNVLPRVAALLDVAQVSDIVEVVDARTFKRYIYAGNALATVKSQDGKQVLTVRTTAFEAAAEEGGSAVIEPLAAPTATSRVRFVGREVHKSERPELTSARVVVSGGRGVASADNFRLIEELADALGAAVGASRAAVDAGYRPNDYQVGQTGKIVAPELYIAVGISGAIQHLAGMKDSKIIVAINKDEEAPIFQVADFGLVADLFQAVPAMTAALKA
ncbi:electron transfer flavoprotein alpha subunit apoprotein [Arboricoccus pini]|uniref:Electron transfer flavoprotein subunit alpha n=1 Tax=Arboricoccus pini TaxID=1963835 RepID=A0A212RE56_9PROT|nr:electron transfer flavoprotein subunit alpha/FixB family protein [Arboricoccus pini]SNB70452.1 electron transfer flavoprotein alpha subunit apoprotein [Arboricoccus pini]